MTKKLTLLAMALVMVGLLAVPVLAQRWGGPGYGRHMYGPADQTTIKYRQQLWEKQRALYDEMGKAKPDAAKVRTLTGEVNTLRSKLFSRATQYRVSRGGSGRWGRGGYHRGGWGRGYHMGPGYGMGPGNGGCW